MTIFSHVKYLMHAGRSQSSNFGRRSYIAVFRTSTHANYTRHRPTRALWLPSGFNLMMSSPAHFCGSA